MSKAPPVADTSTDGPGDNSSSDYKRRHARSRRRVADDVKRAMAEFISGRKLAPLAAGDARNMPNRCTSRVLMRDIAAGPVWNGWSPDATNARFHRASGLSASDVPRLTLKWAFGFPGVSSVCGQPTVAGGRVFVGVDTGCVYALDAASGCVHWSFLAETGVPADQHWAASAHGGRGRRRSRLHQQGVWLHFGDIRGNCLGRCQHGRAVWKVNADPHPLAAITGSPTLCEAVCMCRCRPARRLQAASDYPCCTFRGSIVALDAATGRQLWKTYAIADPKPSRRNSQGRSSGPAQGRPSARSDDRSVTVPSTLLLATPIPNRRQRPPTP